METFANRKPFYSYVPLPSTNAIRLLVLHTATSCSLDIIDDLANSPPYGALSYTWGNPQSPYSSSYIDLPQLSVPSIPISCDGETILVTPNLSDALRMLFDTYTSNYGLSHTYIWIDAICIDQGNLAERTMQVSLMGDLYRKAKTVLVWLGYEDEFTADTFTTMERLASIPKDLYEVVEAQDFHNAQMVTSKLGILPLSHRNWLGWVAFLHRPYFKRVWVVQEVSLADRVLCICGSRRVPWESFSDAVMFTHESKWSGFLHTQSLRRLDNDNIAPEYHKLLSVDIDPGFSAYSLVTTKLFITTFRQALPFRKLIEEHRETSASDPRDKIYAILGLADKHLKPFTGHAEALVVDYNIDIQTLYTRITGLNSNWCAAAGLSWKPDAWDMDDKILRVQGMRIGIIHNMSGSMFDAEDSLQRWTSIAQLALELPPYYHTWGNPDFDAWVKLIQSEPIESAFGLDELSRVYAAIMAESQQPDSITQADYERSFAQVRLEMSLTLNCRRVFRTEGNLLGVGPDNMELGDEVWLLAGSRTPFVLRKVTEQGSDYRIRGEAYVHGFMHGQAMDLSLDLVDLNLV
ncbi:MAG: hypothetical protein Q9213_001313 [Squamulea squamosa]